MTHPKYTIGSGAALGVVAGVIFALVETLVAVAMGQPALGPIRMIAAIALGPEALSFAPLANALPAGLVVHVALSALFGALYGALVSLGSDATRTSPAREAGIGAAFGIALWAVNFHLIARAAFPWFLGTDQFVQALVHAFAFGVPLAVMLAYRERRWSIAEHARA